MEKYKRFKEEITGDEEIQKFLDRITSEGWEIIYYREQEYGGMGTIQVTAVTKKSRRIL